MAYDLGLEERVEDVIASWGMDVPKKKIFGGLGYFLNGNMVFGIAGDDLIVKTDEATGEKLLKEPGIRPFKFGDRPAMKSWLLAGGDALADDDNLVRLLKLSRDYVQSLPPKAK
jgi:TfoX/Sxy family transcriptional regulator of competence genes